VNETSNGAQGFGRWLRRAGFVAVVSVVTLPVPAQSQSQPPGFADLAARLLPAVVNISTTQNVKAEAKPNAEASPGSPSEDFFKNFLQRQGHGEPAHKAMALGSGFIIDPAGLVVTNNHVIADADEITVILQDDTKLKAELVGRDIKTDLALLRVKTEHKLSAVKFGDSEQERVGDWVLAVGNPFGLGGTVTSGIVSARAREISNNDGIYDDFLQTDAPINRGNSGGPLFNLAGEVIGINTAIFSPSGGSIGIGFAIPSTLARNIVAQLKEYGHTRRGWFGARIQSVDDDVALGLGLDKPKGVLVAGLIDKAPAQQAGIQPGDVLLAIDGRDVSDARRFERMIADEPVDQRIKLKVWRRRQEKLIEVKVGELVEKDPVQTASIAKTDQKAAPPAQIKALGLLVAEATPQIREKFQLSESAAVIVTNVTKGGPAGDRDIKPGDAIVEAGEQEVKRLDDLTKRVEEAKKAGRKSMLLLVDRGGELHFVAIRLDQG
jgi:serine protease Do